MQFGQIKRREFITLLSGAAMQWPLAARAQQPAMLVVGFLGPALDTRRHWIATFRRGLGAEGFVEGQNAMIEYRSADGGVTLPELAAELVPASGRGDLRLRATRSARR